MKLRLTYLVFNLNCMHIYLSSLHKALNNANLTQITIFQVQSVLTQFLIVLLKMALPEITNFESLLPETLTNNKKYIRSEIEPLTAAGENYASEALAINIVLQQENGEEERVNAVAKLLASNPFMQLFMSVPFTFHNELGFYQTILPTLRQFQQQQGSHKTLDSYPKFYGGRINIDPSVKIVDENAIILMENLKVSGYIILDKNVGFDITVTKLILEKMAELHGAVIGLKEHQKETFEEVLLPYFEEFKIFQMGENEDFMASEIIVNAVMGVVQEDELCVLYSKKIQEMIQTCIENLRLPKNAPKFREDLFASLIHDDLWVNNVMVKTHLNKLVDVKLIDWQLYEYASVTKDILFFLCSSTEDNIFKERFDELITFYYKSLIANLEELKCDTSKFTFEAFQRELKAVATEKAYFYIMTAIPSMFPPSDQVWEVQELTKEHLLGQMQMSEKCRDRVCLITRKFIQNGWI